MTKATFKIPSEILDAFLDHQDVDGTIDVNITEDGKLKVTLDGNAGVIVTKAVVTIAAVALGLAAATEMDNASANLLFCVQQAIRIVQENDDMRMVL